MRTRDDFLDKLEHVLQLPHALVYGGGARSVCNGDMSAIAKASYSQKNLYQTGKNIADMLHAAIKHHATTYRLTYFSL